MPERKTLEAKQIRRGFDYPALTVRRAGKSNSNPNQIITFFHGEPPQEFRRFDQIFRKLLAAVGGRGLELHFLEDLHMPIGQEAQRFRASDINSQNGGFSHQALVNVSAS